MPAQLVLPFGIEPAFGPDDFFVAPCNRQAFQFIASWPDWPARAAALHGPRSSGKSHLIGVWRARSKAALISAPHLTAEHVTALDPDHSVAVEAADVPGLDLPERDRALMMLFERPAGSVLFTGRTPPSQWPSAIGDVRSRFDSLLAFPVWAPDDDLLRNLIRKHFADRQLEVPGIAVERILVHLERTPEAIAGFVARADAKALSERRAVTERLVLELITAEEQMGLTR
jgi:chromosomal replication initiation ATPase DnaA